MNRNLLKMGTLLALPLALSLWGPAAMANPNSGHMHGMTQERGDLRPNRAAFAERHAQMMSQLGLTPEQQAQFKTLREQGKGQGKELHQQMQAKKQSLMEYLKSPNATEAHAMEIQAEISALQNQMSTQRIHTWFQMRQILTPEQLQKLEQLHMQQPGPGPKKPMEGNTRR